MSTLSFEHQIAFITTRITIDLPAGGGTSIGTGFLIQTPLEDGTDRSITLLMSNKHVFMNSSGRLVTTFNQKKADGTPDYGNTMTFDQIGFSDAYYEHPDVEVDLACVNISAIWKTNAFFKTLHHDFFRPIDYEKVAAGTDVIFVGYPDNRFDVVNNLPLIRKGYIASLPDIDFNGKSQIIIDAQVFQGSSGSPVFVAWDGSYSLLGVVSQTMIKHSMLQTVPATISGFSVQQILGLGIVIKQSAVKELVAYATAEFVRRNRT